MTVALLAVSSIVLAAVAATSAAAASPQEQRTQLELLQRIQTESTGNSRLMDTASWLADVFGPRLANSPSYDAATEWARDRLVAFGVEASVEPYGEFGVTWRNEYTSVHMLQPRYMSVIAYPNTWSSGIGGRRRARAVHLDYESLRSNCRSRALPRPARRHRGASGAGTTHRGCSSRLLPSGSAPRQSPPSLRRVWRVRNSREKSAPSRFPGTPSSSSPSIKVPWRWPPPDGRESYGNVLVNEVPGRAWLSEAEIHPPFLILAAEHYNRMVRILDKGVEVELELDVRIAVDELSRQDTNVIAEIPGSDLADQVVMLGAHLDANSAGQGAIDNAGSAATVMEVMRVLRAIGLQPRRTIRMALWGGEEYGLVGSRRYVEQAFGGVAGLPATAAHERFAIYFNKDGGSGRVRGVYLQENAALAPLAAAWLEPLASFGVAHISNRANFNSDQASFDRAGLPSIMFIQDPLERRGYHTNMDTFDHLHEPDLIQSAIVIASLVAQAAMSDKAVPRSLPMTARGHRE